MKKIIILAISAFLLTGCVSIPPESVKLSATIGNDLDALHKSHRAFVSLHYDKIKNEINQFIDDVYAPFAISRSLEIEMEEFKKDRESLPGLIQKSIEGEDLASKEVLNYMQDFLEITNEDIESMRNELIQPIKDQEELLLKKVDQAYANTIQANAILTSHLQSLRDVKEAQSEAYQLMGLNNIDETINEYALNASEIVSKATKTAKNIDVKSDEVLDFVNEIKDKLETLKK